MLEESELGSFDFGSMTEEKKRCLIDPIAGSNPAPASQQTFSEDVLPCSVTKLRNSSRCGPSVKEW
jgi:hypothetical protein